ncbi:hypothetical protein SLS58_002395 [Diplodia intermedia]|uniref:Uncharacterized protein n=1 Tax=Diplodia intermedia TaxID=856260 RepID=A0ABR3U0C2_9PEZI
MDGIRILPGRGSWDLILPRLRSILKSLEQVDFASLLEDDPNDFPGFAPDLWQFIDSDQMADAVDGLRAEFSGHKPRGTVLPSS